MTKIDKNAKKLGMNYKVSIPGIEPLYVRFIANVGVLLREMYPKAKNVKVNKI